MPGTLGLGRFLEKRRRRLPGLDRGPSRYYDLRSAKLFHSFRAPLCEGLLRLAFMIFFGASRLPAPLSASKIGGINASARLTAPLTVSYDPLESA